MKLRGLLNTICWNSQRQFKILNSLQNFWTVILSILFYLFVCLSVSHSLSLSLCLSLSVSLSLFLLFSLTVSLSLWLFLSLSFYSLTLPLSFSLYLFLHFFFYLFLYFFISFKIIFKTIKRLFCPFLLWTIWKEMKFKCLKLSTVIVLNKLSYFLVNLKTQNGRKQIYANALNDDWQKSGRINFLLQIKWKRKKQTVQSWYNGFIKSWYFSW